MGSPYDSVAEQYCRSKYAPFRQHVEQWAAMNLMGEYASANHHTIHDRVLKLARAPSSAVGISQ